MANSKCLAISIEMDPVAEGGAKLWRVSSEVNVSNSNFHYQAGEKLFCSPAKHEKRQNSPNK